MKKLFRKIKVQIKMTIVNVIRNFALTISASFCIFLTMTLVAALALVTSNLNYMSQNIESELSIRVSIDPVLNEEEIIKLQDDIKKLDGVVDVQFRDKDEELAAYKKEYKSSDELFSMYEGDSNPITDALVIKAQSAVKMKSISLKISIMDGVLRVSDGGTMAQQLLQIFDMIQYGGTITIIVFLLMAIFLIANKIKMSIYTRRDEFAIMRFVGAGNWFIRIPMMLEGMIIGLIGATPAAVLTILGYFALYQDMDGVVMSNMLTLQPTMPLATTLAVLLIICGMTVGLIGSLISTSRNLKWKR